MYRLTSEKTADSRKILSLEEALISIGAFRWWKPRPPA
jgi:hypothetical protein